MMRQRRTERSLKAAVPSALTLESGQDGAVDAADGMEWGYSSAPV